MDNLESIVRQRGCLDLILAILRETSNQEQFNRISDMYEKMLRSFVRSEEARKNPGLVRDYTGKYLALYYAMLENAGENPAEIYSFEKVG